MFFFFCSPFLAGADDSLGEKISPRFADVFAERRESTVRVEAYDRHGKLSATGFLLTRPARSIRSTTLSLMRRKFSSSTEIGVCPQSSSRPIPEAALPFSRSTTTLHSFRSGIPRSFRSPRLSLAIGFPVNLAATPSFGIVGGFDRQFLGRYFMTTHIRAIVPVEPGFGGAPLMNLKGEVVGIIISGIEGGGACYALPIEAAEKLRLDYVRFGEPRYGWVGANVEDENEPGDGSHVRIAELGPESPAAQSGLKEGDIVSKIGGVKIATAEDVIDASFFLTAGDRVSDPH